MVVRGRRQMLRRHRRRLPLVHVLRQSMLLSLRKKLGRNGGGLDQQIRQTVLLLRRLRLRQVDLHGTDELPFALLTLLLATQRLRQGHSSSLPTLHSLGVPVHPRQHQLVLRRRHRK